MIEIISFLGLSFSFSTYQVENIFEQVHKASAMETSELWPNLVSKSSLSGAAKQQNGCNNSHDK